MIQILEQILLEIRRMADVLERMCSHFEEQMDDVRGSHKSK